MQKETFLAIMIGLILGLGVTFTIYSFKTHQQEKKVVETEATIEQKPSPTSNVEAKGLLKLKTPLEGLVTEQNLIKVAGSFKSHAYLAVSLGKETSILPLTGENFSLEQKLALGPNMIYLSAIDENGTIEDQQRFVFYEASDSAAAKVPEATETGKLKTDADHASTTSAILARISKKVGKTEPVVAKQRAIFGQVKRITEESMTVATHFGQIILPINNEVKLTHKQKSIKINDVVVDSWVVVLGKISSPTNANDDIKQLKSINQISPQLIQVYNKNPLPEKPVVTIGTIKNVKSKRLVLVSRKNNEEKTLFLTKNSQVQDLTGKPAKLIDLKNDLNILAVTEKNSQGELIVKQIKILVEL